LSMASPAPNTAPGREERTLSSLPEITVDIPRTPMRANTNETFSTLADDISPATLVPNHSFKPSHSRDPSSGNFSAVSASSLRNPFGRSRAASEATLAPPPTSAGASTHSRTGAFTLDAQRNEDALKPDPGLEKDFTVADNKFAFSPGQLNKMLNPKSLAAFIALGGLPGLETGLRTDVDSGLSLGEPELAGSVSFEEVTKRYKKFRGADASGLPRPVEVRHVDVTSSKPSGSGAGSHAGEAYYDRKRVFGTNLLPAKKPISFLALMWQAYYKENVLILLTIAAVISLALGLYETFGVDHGPGAPPSIDWIEGCAICVSIVVVVMVGAVNDYQKERVSLYLLRLPCLFFRTGFYFMLHTPCC